MNCNLIKNPFAIKTIRVVLVLLKLSKALFILAITDKAAYGTHMGLDLR